MHHSSNSKWHEKIFQWRSENFEVSEGHNGNFVRKLGTVYPKEDITPNGLYFTLTLLFR